MNNKQLTPTHAVVQSTVADYSWNVFQTKRTDSASWNPSCLFLRLTLSPAWPGPALAAGLQASQCRLQAAGLADLNSIVNPQHAWELAQRLP